MYISRRGDTVGPPVWKSTILHIFLKSELSVLETVAVRVPMTYIEPSTPSYTNSYRVSDCCRQDNGPICELPTETELTARACHYHHPEICYEFDMQKLSIPFRVWLPIQPLTHPSGSND